MLTITGRANAPFVAGSLGLLAFIAVMSASGNPALASVPAETVKTPTGLVLTVTPTTALAPVGATVTVTGRGYDRTVGIYVALCVTPQAGKPATVTLRRWCKHDRGEPRIRVDLVESASVRPKTGDSICQGRPVQGSHDGVIDHRDHRDRRDRRDRRLSHGVVFDRHARRPPPFRGPTL